MKATAGFVVITEPVIRHVEAHGRHDNVSCIKSGLCTAVGHVSIAVLGRQRPLLLERMPCPQSFTIA